MKRRGFTLIELLIVVAIIAILAAIAVPNFLEAQVRAKVSRSKTDMRSMATAIEAYRVDHNHYPEGTDNINNYPQELVDFFGPLAAGYYSFRTRGNGKVLGRDFAGITTPVAYMTAVPGDAFASHLGKPIAYAYRNAKTRKNGWVLTSFGPDSDALAAGGKGTQSNSPLGTKLDTKTPSRLGDVNEAGVISYLERSSAATVTGVESFGGLAASLSDVTYDPTNGTVSDGDLIRLGP